LPILGWDLSPDGAHITVFKHFSDRIHVLSASAKLA
jgi:hypothetical protein